jgi:hypothetical protein
MTDARTAVRSIIERDGLDSLPAEEIERLIELYAETRAEVAQLRAPEVARAEPAVIYRAD